METRIRTDRAGAAEPASMLAVSVYGPRGVVDLTVPAATTIADLARTYGRHTGLRVPLRAHRRTGAPLAAEAAAGAVLAHGAVVVLAASPDGPEGAPAAPAALTPEQSVAAAARATSAAGTVPLAWFGLIGCGLAAFLVADTGSFWLRVATINLLAAAVLVCLVPRGPRLAQRYLVAPGVAASAAFLTVPDPLPGLALAAVAAAVVALGADAAGSGHDDPRARWGTGVWVVAAGVVLLAAQVSWLTDLHPEIGRVPIAAALLLVAAAFAVRAGPAYALTLGDGPQRIDPTAVREAAARAAVRVEAAMLLAGAAVVALAVVLLGLDQNPLDRWGTWALIGAAAGAMALGVRAQRSTRVRVAVRGAATVAAALLVARVVQAYPTSVSLLTACLAAVAGLGLIGAAVAAGRGRRSLLLARLAGWSEQFLYAVLLPAALVSGGFLRVLWTT